MSIKPFPLEGEVERILQSGKGMKLKPTGCSRETYLDIAEPIVQMAAEWVDQDGAVIDPILKKEWAQTSSRFASSAAVLIHFGRCREMLAKVCKVMSRCCSRMASGEAKDMSSNFWTRELITADMCLEGIAPKELQEAWRKDLRKFVPEEVYRFVDPTHGPKLSEFHNWAVYSAGGEALRELAGLSPDTKDFLHGKDFFDIYMEPQMSHMTEYGMYRDPGDPFTYDITTRLQFALPLSYGLKSKLASQYEELLRRGGLTMLLFVSPEGYVPYGGRSSQFHFQEAIISALSELEAKRYKGNNDQLAGAFKRQAHRSALSVKRWITGASPIRHIKNMYQPETSHGIDRYGQYSVYSLLCSSFFGVAALCADDSIEEAITPAEIGGFVLTLSPAFNKVFANAAGTYIEIDTKADLHYDSTGLGRVLFSGTPIEMILSMPFAHEPSYRFAEGESSTMNTALGCTWKSGGTSFCLASQNEERDPQTGELMSPDDALRSSVEVHTATVQEADFSVHYILPKNTSKLTERYTLKKDQLTCTSSATVGGKPAEEITYRVPVLLTDGTNKSEISLTPGVLSGKYMDSQWTVEWDKDTVTPEWEDQPQSNRNGRYRILQLHTNSNSIKVTIHNQ